MSAYLELGLLKRNPFEVVDPDGVGELVRLGVERGRATRPDLKIGVCGEHGGDPESIATFAAAGLDYVSCSPFRVPIARLAAAQAVLAGPRPPKPGSATRRPGRPRGPGQEGRRQGRRRPRATAKASRGRVRRRPAAADRAGEPADAVPSSPMGIPDEDVARVRAATDIVALVGEHAALKQVGRRWSRAVPVPRREDARRSASTPRRASTTASAARPRATPSASCGRSSTSTSSTPCAGWPTRPGITIREDAGGGPGQPAPQGVPRRHGAGHRVVPPAPADRRPTPARPGTTCAAGATTARSCAGSGWAGPPTTGTRCARPSRLQRGGRRRAPASGSSTGGAGSRTPSGPGSSSRSATPRAARWPSGGRILPPAGQRRPEPSTRTPPRPRSTPSAAPSTPSTGPSRTIIAHRRGGGVRGVHRRHRVLPGRACRGPWPPAAPPWPRSTSSCCAASPRGSCWPSTPTAPASRAAGRFYEWERKLRGRRGRGRPARRLRPRRAGPERPRGPARAPSRGPSRSSSSGWSGSWPPPTSTTPEGRARAADAGPGGRGRAPRRPGAGPVRDAGGRAVPARRRVLRERLEQPAGPPAPPERAGRRRSRPATGRASRAEDPGDDEHPTADRRPGHGGRGAARGRSAGPGLEALRAGHPPTRGGRPTGSRRSCSPTRSSARPSSRSSSREPARGHRGRGPPRWHLLRRLAVEEPIGGRRRTGRPGGLRGHPAAPQRRPVRP